MKGSSERKLMLGGFALCLLLMGMVRAVSYQNATQLIESSNRVEQSEEILNHLREICTAMAEEEAGRLTYLLQGNESHYQRHLQGIQRLHQHLQKLQPLIVAAESDQQQLTKLQSLINQRAALASQSIRRYQVNPAAIDQQFLLINQLNQNYIETKNMIDILKNQEESLLVQRDRYAALHTRYHIIIELIGTILIFVTILGLYALIYRQMLKRNHAESAQQKLAHDKEMSELKLQFFSMVSHEFRTPLSIILGSAQLLEENSDQWTVEKKHKNLDRIQSAARTMNQLLTDILTLTRAEAGKLEFHPQSLDLEGFCLNLVEDIRLSSQSSRVIQFINRSPESHVHLDENLLHSILSNLLYNALKYSPSETPVCLSLDSDSEAIIFEVADQGIGILPDNITNLYQPFYRGQNIGKTVGAGLGLAVVQKCLEPHQGTISVNTCPNVGTTFTVRIPQPQDNTRGRENLKRSKSKAYPRVDRG